MVETIAKAIEDAELEERERILAAARSLGGVAAEILREKVSGGTRAHYAETVHNIRACLIARARSEKLKQGRKRPAMWLRDIWNLVDLVLPFQRETSNVPELPPPQSEPEKLPDMADPETVAEPE